MFHKKNFLKGATVFLLSFNFNGALAQKDTSDLQQLYAQKLNENKQKKYGPFVNGKLLFPTVIKSTQGEVLGLAYTTKDSLQEALKKKKGIYYSRSRDGLWVKSPSGRNAQNLIDVRFNCDGTALLFEVEQRGVFCHENILSCFEASLNKDLRTLNPQKALRIGISKGARQSQLAYDLLASFGLDIYKNKASRNTQFSIKTHLHPKVEVVEARHHDLETLLERGYIDLAIGYDNVVPESLNKNYLKLQKEGGIKRVKVAAIYKKDKKLPKNPVIFTEYPQISKVWCKEKFAHARVVPVQGGAEKYVADGLADMAIVVIDSGATLKSHGLAVYDTITTSDLSLYYSKKALKKHSNFLRTIKNKLQTTKIYFFDVDDRDNGYLSNFYPAKFVTHEEGQKETWQTSEHYYHAHKFKHHSDPYKKILRAKTAKESYKIAHQHEGDVKKDWLTIKDQIMFKALNYKFRQNPDLMKKLLATKNKELLEHSADTYWGAGIQENGLNTLGKLLGKLRGQLHTNT